MEWIYKGDEPILETIGSAFLIVVLLIVITRIIGLRSFAKFTVYDFAITVAIGSIISSTLTSTASVVQGFTAIASLLILTLLFSFLQKSIKKFDEAISNKPILLMDGPEILHQNLSSAHVQKDQVIAKLREANVLNFDQVYAVVLETTGDISVLHKSKADSRERFDQQLLYGVSHKGRSKTQN